MKRIVFRWFSAALMVLSAGVLVSLACGYSPWALIYVYWAAAYARNAYDTLN